MPPYLVARRALRAERRGAVGALSLGEGAGGEVEPLFKGKEGTGVIFEKRGSGNYSRKSLLVVILSASVGATSSATA